MSLLSIKDLPVRKYPECEQLRAIRTQSKGLTADEVSDVQTKLSQDYRFARLSVEFAKITKNEKYVFEAILGSNSYVIAQVVKFRWLYETNGQGFLRDNFIVDTLPRVSLSTRFKIVHNIGKYVNDTKLGDKLWELIRPMSIGLANSLFAACSNELILRQVPTSWSTVITGGQLQSILKKRFESGCDLVEGLILLKGGIGRMVNTAALPNSIHYILERDLERGYKLWRKAGLRWRFVGSRISRKLIKSIQASPISSEDMSFFVDHLQYFPLKSLQRYASYDLYLEFFLYYFITTDDDNADKLDIHTLLKHLSNDKKFHHLEEFFKKKYKRTINESPSLVHPSMLYMIDEEKRREVVEARLCLSDYSNSTCSDFHGKTESKLFWRSLLPLSTSFDELKDLIENEQDVDKRRYFYQLFLYAPLVRRDERALIERLQIVVPRMTHEPLTTITTTLGCAYNATKLFRRCGIELWMQIEQLILLIFKHEADCSLISSVSAEFLQKSQGDEEIIDRLAAIIASEHLRIFRSLKEHINTMSVDDANSFYRKILQERENVLERVEENNHRKFDSLQDIYSIIYSNAKIDGPKLLAGFPRSVKYLKSLLLSPKSMIEDCCEFAYWLVEKQLTEDEARVATKPAASYSELRKNIYKNGIVTINDLEWILKDDELKKDTKFLRFISMKAFYGKTSQFIEKAISLSEEPERHESAFKFLAVTMPLDDFEDYFKSLAPKLNGSTLNVQQKALLHAMKLLSDSTVILKMVLPYLNDQHLKESLTPLYSASTRSPADVVLEFTTSKIQDSSANIWKHIVRIYFMYSSSQRDVVQQLIDQTKNERTRLPLLKVLYEIIENGEDEYVPHFSNMIDEITDKNDHIEVMEFLYEKNRVDTVMSGIDLSQVLLRIFSLTFTNESGRCYLLFRIAHANADKIPTHLFQRIMDHAFPLNLVYCKDAVKCFVELAIRYNSDELHSMLNDLYTRCNEVASANAVVKLLVERIVSDELTIGVDRSLILSALYDYFTEEPGRHLERIVCIELVRGMMKIVSENIENNSIDFQELTRKCTLYALPVIEKYLQLYGAYLFQPIEEQLKIALKLFSESNKIDRIAVLKCYNISTSAIQTAVIMGYLPNPRKVPEEHIDFVNGLKKQILEGNDEAVKFIVYKR